MSIYTFFSFIGAGASFITGSVHTQFIPGIRAHTRAGDWRNNFIIVALPSFLLAHILLFTVAEPQKGRFDENVVNEPNRVSFLKSVRYLLRTPTYWAALLGDILRSFGANAVSAFVAVFYLRTFGFSQQNQAMWLTWILPLGGIVGVLFTMTGVISRFSSKSMIAHPIVSVTCMVLVTISGAASLAVQNVYWSMALMGVTTFFNVIWNGSSVAVAIEVIPAPMRTLSSSLFSLMGSIIGGFPPVVVGMLTDSDPFHMGPIAVIRYSLLTVSGVSYVLATLVLIIPIFTITRDINRVNRPNRFTFGKYFGFLSLHRGCGTDFSLVSSSQEDEAVEKHLFTPTTPESDEEVEQLIPKQQKVDIN
jgi:MFS family permease